MAEGARRPQRRQSGRGRTLDEIVDVARVPARGDPAIAVVRVPEAVAIGEIECEVLVVGGGTGGVAAALAAARRGRRVCLTEETDWLGGQLTAQGVSALDEHDLIEQFGGTASYYALRQAIRAHYGALGLADPERGNPGSCWVSALAFEPTVGVSALAGLLAPFVESGHVRVFLRTKPVAVVVTDAAIATVTTVDLERDQLTRFRPEFVIDATELGDLLPLAEIEYRVGAETTAETGEPHAQPEEPKPRCVQSLTYTFALERTAVGSVHSIARPAKFERYRDAQPYSLTIEVHGGEIYGEESGWLDYRLFERMPGTKGPTLDLPQADRRRHASRRLAARHHDVQLAGERLSRRHHSRRSGTPRRSGPAGRETRQPRLPALAPDSCAGDGQPRRCPGAAPAGRRDGIRRRPVEASLHPRSPAHPRPPYRGRAGRLRRAPLRTAGGSLRRLGRDRLVSDRHSPVRPRGRRSQYAHTAVPDPARRTHPCRNLERRRPPRRTSGRRTSRTGATASIPSSGTSARRQVRSPPGRSRGACRRSRSGAIATRRCASSGACSRRACRSRGSWTYRRGTRRSRQSSCSQCPDDPLPRRASNWCPARRSLPRNGGPGAVPGSLRRRAPTEPCG